jgi:aryl carrier-like protein
MRIEVFSDKAFDPSLIQSRLRHRLLAEKLRNSLLLICTGHSSARLAQLGANLRRQGRRVTTRIAAYRNLVAV